MFRDIHPFLGILELCDVTEPKWVAFNEGEDTGACNATQIRAVQSFTPSRIPRPPRINPFGVGCAWVRLWEGRRLNYMGGAEGPGYRPGTAICTPQGEQPSELAFALHDPRMEFRPRICTLTHVICLSRCYSLYLFFTSFFFFYLYLLYISYIAYFFIILYIFFIFF